MKRRTKKRALRRKILAIVFTIVILAGLSYTLGYSHVITLRSLSVTGTQQSSVISQSILAESRTHIGQPLARVNLRVIKKSIENISWVKRASISRNWFTGNISVKIEERKPIASFLIAANVSNYFDSEGNQFFTPLPIVGLPVITFASNAKELRITAAAALKQMPQDVLDGLVSMKVASGKFIESTEHLGGKNFVIRWGEPLNFALKVKVLRILVGLPENATARVFDLTEPTAPIVK